RDQLASQLRRIDGCTARPHSVLESLQAVGLIAKPQPPNPRLISPKPLRDTRDACAFAEHHQRSCSLHHGRRFATPLHGTQQLVPVLLPKHQPAWLGTPLRRRNDVTSRQPTTSFLDLHGHLPSMGHVPLITHAGECRSPTSRNPCRTCDPYN